VIHLLEAVIYGTAAFLVLFPPVYLLITGHGTQNTCPTEGPNYPEEW